MSNNTSQQTETENALSSGLEIFISHPHRYSAFADVLRETIDDWSSGTITVHQTSDAGANPMSVGEAIRPQLEDYLKRSSLVLLIFVNAESANYCMWEAGVAVARGEGPLSNTRIVVFQCESEIPTVFKDDLMVRLTKESIRKFAFDFHKNETFFPLLGNAFAELAPADLIERRSKKLYADLIAARPGTALPPETTPRWISFEVSLAEAHANEIEQIANAVESSTGGEGSGLDRAIARGQELIEQHAIIEDCPPQMPNHFDMAEVRKGITKLAMLHTRWENRMRRDGNSEYITVDWWTEVCRQITLSVAAYSAKEIETPFKSVAEKTWYLPIVTHKTLDPASKKVKFDISLIRIPQEGKFIRVKVSNAEQ